MARGEKSLLVAGLPAVACGDFRLHEHLAQRADGGVDSDFSLEPGELASLVTETDVARRALGPARLPPLATLARAHGGVARRH